MAEQPNNFQIFLRRALHDPETLREEKGAFFDGNYLGLSAMGGGTSAAAEAGAATALFASVFIARELKNNGHDLQEAFKTLEAYEKNCLKTGKENSGINIVDLFNEAIGSSAGAPTLCYAATGQVYNGSKIYFEDLPKSEFLSMGRGFKWVADEITNRKKGSKVEHKTKPIMDLDFLSDVIDGKFDPAKGLDFNKFFACKTIVSFFSLDVDERKPVKMNGFKSREQLLNAIKSACRIPGVTDIPDLMGKRLYDAGRFGFNNPIAAIDDFQNKRFMILSPNPFCSDPELGRFGKLMDSFITQGTRFIAEDLLRDGNEFVRFANTQVAREIKVARESQQNPLHSYFGTPEGSPKISSAEQKTEKLKNAVVTSYTYTLQRMLGAMALEGLIPAEAAQIDIPVPLAWAAEAQQVLQAHLPKQPRQETPNTLRKLNCKIAGKITALSRKIRSSGMSAP